LVQLRRFGDNEPVAFAISGATLMVTGSFGFDARGPSLRPAMHSEV
jgi:hypothetical protein